MARVFLLSSAASVETGDYTEPHLELTFAKFVTPLVSQVAAVLRAEDVGRIILSSLHHTFIMVQKRLAQHGSGGKIGGRNLGVAGHSRL